MQNIFRTNRLLLSPLAPGDVEFILELVNTPEWIKFIGDRNIRTKDSAKDYIQNIINNPTTQYWIVKLKEKKISIGIITFIKRNYLEHHDIGFAFLSGYSKKGFAYEASQAVLHEVTKDFSHTHILAATIKENIHSIRLLEKLGLQFDKEIQTENEKLLLYSMATNKSLIDKLTEQFFTIFNNTNDQQPNWNIIHEICLAQTIIIKKNNLQEDIYNLQTFIEPRKKMLSDGTLTEFEEIEIKETTTIVDNIAQRFSYYNKKGILNGIPFEGHGNKFFQFIKSDKGWKINSIVWEDEKN